MQTSVSPPVPESASKDQAGGRTSQPVRCNTPRQTPHCCGTGHNTERNQQPSVFGTAGILYRNDRVQQHCGSGVLFNDVIIQRRRLDEHGAVLERYNNPVPMARAISGMNSYSGRRQPG